MKGARSIVMVEILEVEGRRSSRSFCWVRVVRDWLSWSFVSLSSSDSMSSEAIYSHCLKPMANCSICLNISSLRQ